ncbi:MAG: hypothetical protein ABWK01_06085 [Infirmifilum sp.]
MVKCGESGAIEGSLAEAIAGMIVVRNIVHRCLGIDYERVYAETKRLVEVAREFEKQIRGFVKRELTERV